MDTQLHTALKNKAREVRTHTLLSIGKLGVGHVGGSLSVTEVLTYLYFYEMEVHPEAPRHPDRDRLVLSKGHAGPALYSVLALKGFFPLSMLDTLNQGGTSLPSHCDRTRTPGIDMTTGSLGQGLSAAVGIALANRMDGRKNYVYAVIGDGESQEGQIWEAAMSAGHFGLSRLIAYTDYNKMQIDGTTKDIMNIDTLESKWLSFGWNVQRIDGHNFTEIADATARAKSQQCRPSMIILDTVKGKGCHLAEGKLSSHNMPLSEEEARESVRILEGEQING